MWFFDGVGVMGTGGRDRPQREQSSPKSGSPADAAARLPGRARRLLQYCGQAIVDFLIEDACVLCGSAPHALPVKEPLDGFASPLGEPVTCRLVGIFPILNHPVCARCLAAFSAARGAGVLGMLIPPATIVTTAGECFAGPAPGTGSGEVVGASAKGHSIEPCSKMPTQTPIRVVAPFMTDDNVLKIMHLIKFSGYGELVPQVAATVVRAVEAFGLLPGRHTVAVPVPMERAERRRRKLNAAEAFAAEISRRFGIPLIAKGLTKIRRTGPQAQTAHSERADNVRGAFTAAGEGLARKDVLLVDDLVTTGATAASCAAALLAAGARSVTVLGFARAL